jgi:hypothetical protein
MHKNEFNSLVSTDIIPDGKTCEWCQERADKQFTAIGGMHHNKSGIFCHSCGEEFSQVVLTSQVLVQANLLVRETWTRPLTHLEIGY